MEASAGEVVLVQHGQRERFCENRRLDREIYGRRVLRAAYISIRGGKRLYRLCVACNEGTNSQPASKYCNEVEPPQFIE